MYTTFAYRSVTVASAPPFLIFKGLTSTTYEAGAKRASLFETAVQNELVKKKVSKVVAKRRSIKALEVKAGQQTYYVIIPTSHICPTLFFYGAHPCLTLSWHFILIHYRCHSIRIQATIMKEFPGAMSRCFLGVLSSSC